MGDKYLMDTHCLIWYQDDNPKMPKRVSEIIQSRDNVIFFSQLSLIEISIKQKIGKLPAFKSSITKIYEQALEDGFTFLEIKNQHIITYQTIPLFEQHRDPFDRLLISTAYAEKTKILTADKNFDLYKEFVSVVW